MRILGIDPGSRQTGLAVIDWTPDDVTLVDLGYWRPSCHRWSCRIGELYDVIETWLSHHLPDAVAIEDVFVHPRYPRTALVLQQIVGVIEAALARNGYGWVAYPSRLVKQSLGGTGGLTKADLRARLQRLFPDLDQLRHMPADVFDALAVALCHGLQGTGPTPGHLHATREVSP